MSSYYCHCNYFYGMHYEQRKCRIMKNLKRKAVQELMDAPVEGADGPDDCDAYHASQWYEQDADIGGEK